MNKNDKNNQSSIKFSGDFMKILHLNLKKQYFEDIKNGSKLFEYRLVTNFWTKRLKSDDFDKILIKSGYPKSGDTNRIIERPYRGYMKTFITHPHFGPDPVNVYAIPVN